MTSGGRSKVVGAGLIALDLVIGSESEVPIRCWAGGTCGNVLSILAYLGWDAYPVARMNGDSASQHVCEDMARWGVHLDWINCVPTTNSPIVVHRIQRDKDGQAEHRFSWVCPNCGKWLPSFKPITVDAVERVKKTLVGASVFFFDRLSRGTLMLAAEASGCGAVVIFEPSGRGNSKLLAEALAIAHVVKYANNRLAGVSGAMEGDSATLVEIQTLGADGLRYRHRLRSWHVQLDAPQGHCCATVGGYLWLWRLVYGRVDCEDCRCRAGRAASRGSARHKGWTSIWSGAGGLELRLRRGPGGNVRRFARGSW